jgi:hypothetical protein
MHHLTTTFIAGLAVLGACGGTNRVTTRSTTEPARTSYTNTPAGPEQQVEPEVAAQDDCMFEIAGATVETAPLDDGVALIFATDPDHVADVRIRARQLAGPNTADPAAATMPGAFRPLTLGTIAVTATVTDTVDGAKLELRAIDPLQVGELRRQARSRVVAMESGACPAMVGSRS